MDDPTKDTIPRSAVEYCLRKETVSTNPEKYKTHEKFIDYMNDPDISEFGHWMHSNGFNCALTTISVDLEKIPSVTPSAQSGQRNARVFQGIIVEYPSISAYPEYEGKPYFSIKYTENGQEFIGYGTYKPEVLSEYLKEYFMPPTQPGCEDAVNRKAVIDAIDKWKEACADNGHKETVSDIKLIRKDFIGLPSVTPKQPGWIPCSESPMKNNSYLVWMPFAPEGHHITVAEWCGSYWNIKTPITAWMPLPKPWEGDANDT